jgi:uncharacterized protein YjbI with pentapeptide repeats
MMDQAKLAAILTAHSLWRSTGGEKGSRANLYGADLSRADLYGADLYGADLSRANLYGANLYGADLSRANLYGANLYGANLSRADLSGADLSRADLYGADLSRADLYVSYFWKWLINANSREMAIGCQRHDWAIWKAKGPALAREHGGAECEKQFRQMWPVLDAARKMLQKRFPAKKATAKKGAK